MDKEEAEMWGDRDSDRRETEEIQDKKDGGNIYTGLWIGWWTRTEGDMHVDDNTGRRNSI